jgi:hypothetical protein
MLTYDPRTISSKVYRQLNDLKTSTHEQTNQKEQKSQAVELYSYVATWGLLRLKAEEFAISQDNKREIIKCFFQTLQEIHFSTPPIPPTQQTVKSDRLNSPNRPTQQAVPPQLTNSLIGKPGLDYLMQREASE